MASSLKTQLDERAQQVLRCLVQRYLQDGNPVASSTVAKNTALSCSSATIRHVMADLEDIGLLVSPHTSAGRIPSLRGIRFFVDYLLTVVPPTKEAISNLESKMRQQTAAEVHTAAASAISQLTKYAGFVAIPSLKPPVIRQLRFVKLSSNRLLAVIVTENGDILNRVFAHDYEVSARELNSAAAIYNRYCANMTFKEAQKLLCGQVLELRGQINILLKSLLTQVEEEKAEVGTMLRVAGELNLLKNEDLSADMRRLHDLYDLLERKKDLIRLLESGRTADNVHVFIGSETGLSALEPCSVVYSSYKGVDGQALGLIGVVGPKRIRYNKVIPTVGIAAKLLSGALTDLRLTS